MSVELTGAVLAERPGGRRAGTRIGLGVAIAVLLGVAVLVVFPGLVVSGSPTSTDTLAAFRAPSGSHWFGTDQLGRDVFTRVVFGARESLFTGLGAVLIGIGGGAVLGLLSAAARGVLDAVLMRVVDVLLAFPELLLALLVVAILGRGSVNVSIAIGVAAVPHFARLVRGQAFAVLESEYVEAARVLGVSRPRYLVRHVLPNVAGPLVVMAAIGTGSAITAASGLSVLGLGPAAPSPEWGAMLDDGQQYLGSAWWIAVFPGIAIVVVVLVLTLAGRSAQARAGR